MPKKRKNNDPDTSGIMEAFKKKTARGIIAVLCLVAAIFLLLSALESAGVAGSLVYNGLWFLLGVGYFLLPIVFLFFSVSMFRVPKEEVRIPKLLISALFLFFAGLGLIATVAQGKGGFIGGSVSSFFVSLFDLYATILILIAAVTVSILVMFDIEPDFSIPSFSIRNIFRRGSREEEETGPVIHELALEETSGESMAQKTDLSGDEFKIAHFEEQGERREAGTPFIPPLIGTYTPPPLSLLEKDRGKPGVGDIKANANIIKRTLQNFGITVEMDEISIGPTVTRYALKPAEGVRLSKIVGLQTNLELALAAHPIRIEAPIPGKSLVGIEVPNTAKATLGLGTLLGGAEYTESSKPLLVSLGKDIAGIPHFADVAKMPHLLIAGTTGSGKSVMIHDLITSLLYRNSPQQLRFIMIDPKRVELTLYNKIPHLLTPVITDAKKAILSLKWAAKEMARRYDILEAETVRDIFSYHKNVFGPALEKHEKRGSNEGSELPEAMPYIIVIIDELADIMQTYPRELEAAIVRLAQMSRAVGIHLVLSTQRPSVNIITGLIKANIPARVAFQVSSQIDSRTILDGGGAEKLLGAGDMLFLSGEMSKPLRIQAPYISEDEVKSVVSFLAKHNDFGLSTAIDLSGTAEREHGNAIFSATLDEEDDDIDDDLYEEARVTVIEMGKASTSFLQRKLRVGYSRAARLMDILEERGVIGPADGSRPRGVLEPRDQESKEPESGTP